MDEHEPTQLMASDTRPTNIGKICPVVYLSSRKLFLRTHPSPIRPMRFTKAPGLPGQYCQRSWLEVLLSSSRRSLPPHFSHTWLRQLSADLYRFYAPLILSRPYPPAFPSASSTIQSNRSRPVYITVGPETIRPVDITYGWTTAKSESHFFEA